jgi:hypothetical protein
MVVGKRVVMQQTQTKEISYELRQMPTDKQFNKEKKIYSCKNNTKE